MAEAPWTFLVVAFAFFAVSSSATVPLCSSSVAATNCVTVSAECVWCAPHLETGPYCINITETAVKTPHACPRCSSYRTSCTLAFSSLSGHRCVKCRDDVGGSYCTAPGEINARCGECGMSQPSQAQDSCTNPAFDSRGRRCEPQCSSEDEFQLISCASRPSNCSACSALMSQQLCGGVSTCAWCNPSFSVGPYCTSPLSPNPQCDCSATSQLMCTTYLSPNAGPCSWCASPNITEGPFCVSSDRPPRWCQEHCAMQTTSVACVASLSPCSWCGDESEEGYFCGTNNFPSPNCSVACEHIFDTTDCWATSCVWCNNNVDVGPYCASAVASCPLCTTYTDSLNCTSSFQPFTEADDLCLWCNGATGTGPYCYAVNANPTCPSCETYTTTVECAASSSLSESQCTWCNPEAINGSYCIGTKSGVNPQCPACSSYLHSINCLGAVVSDGSSCLWCNSLSDVGPYCSSSNYSNCGHTCDTFITQIDCRGSFDIHGPCVWCNAVQSSGPYCSSSLNGTCAPCTTYTEQYLCETARDKVGSCAWCGPLQWNATGNFCTGPAVGNPACTCNTSQQALCMASHAPSGAQCAWCSPLATCFESASTCLDFKCTQLTSRVQCHAAFGCVWCNPEMEQSGDAKLCRSAVEFCPPCPMYSGLDTCSGGFSPPFAASSCFACTPSGACASVDGSQTLDLSKCPSCSFYTTRATCRSAMWANASNCKWCAVSYSCVPDTQGCGDCFSFLVPGNRLKPYWLSFATVVKDYLVLLLAVAIAPRLQHAWQRFATKRRLQSLHAGADERHVVVYLAQDEIVDSNGDALGSLSAVLRTVARSKGRSTQEVLAQWLSDDVMTLSAVDPMVTSTTLYDGDETSVASSPRHVVAGSPINTLEPTEPNPDSLPESWSGFLQRRRVLSTYDINATFVNSRHTLQRAMYAMAQPPNVAILSLGVVAACAFLTAVGVQTNHSFKQRRETNADLFGWDMYFIVLGYRVVNSGLQPTAALTLWQALLGGFERLKTLHYGVGTLQSEGGVTEIALRLRRWNWWTRCVAALQLLLFAPVWGVSMIGVASYGWVFVLALLVAGFASWCLRRIADKVTSAPSPDSTKDQQQASFELCVQRLPLLSNKRKACAALLLFLCQRAIPVLVLSTTLQTGYNYAALYVLAPGHMYSGYLDVVPLEYGARSNVCLLQDVENILGDATASVTSYVIPFA